MARFATNGATPTTRSPNSIGMKPRYCQASKLSKFLQRGSPRGAGQSHDGPRTRTSPQSRDRVTNCGMISFNGARPHVRRAELPPARVINIQFFAVRTNPEFDDARCPQRTRLRIRINAIATIITVRAPRFMTLLVKMPAFLVVADAARRRRMIEPWVNNFIISIFRTSTSCDRSVDPFVVTVSRYRFHHEEPTRRNRSSAQS